MKYELAHSGGHNCIRQGGHSFQIITDKKKKEEIRAERPKLISALWECIHCEKIMESM